MEATSKTHMAGRSPHLIYFEQEGISITIEVDLLDLLKMA
jgi:hypothetical protein